MIRQTLIELLFDVQLENITVTEAADLIEGDKALHDADVIEKFVGGIAKNKNPMSSFNVPALKSLAFECAQQLRNSVK